MTNHLGVYGVTTGPGRHEHRDGGRRRVARLDAVLVVSGQVKRADLKRALGVRSSGVQEIDIISIVKLITKYAVT